MLTGILPVHRVTVPEVASRCQDRTRADR